MKGEQPQGEQQLTISIITTSEELPEMECSNFFHSAELFHIIEKTPGQTPYMLVAKQNGLVVGHMLATLRRRGSWIPPYLFSQGRVYGEGEYTESADKAIIFEQFLKIITQKLRRKMCLYIEFSDLSTKMFGYKVFRKEGYIPIRWMAVHNSLHSAPPEDRIGERVLARIEHAVNMGVEVKEVETEKEFNDFYRMFKNYYSTKVRRYLPSPKMFAKLQETSHCKLFVTKYRNRAIGAATCLYSNRNAYLWYMAAKRKSYPTLHPGTATVWGAITDAYNQHCWHINFLDVGLPFKKNHYRDFILSFGGKEVSTYRWFRYTFPWLNKIAAWLYRE